MLTALCFSCLLARAQVLHILRPASILKIGLSQYQERGFTKLEVKFNSTTRSDVEFHDCLEQQERGSGGQGCCLGRNLYALLPCMPISSVYPPLSLREGIVD